MGRPPGRTCRRRSSPPSAPRPGHGRAPSRTSRGWRGSAKHRSALAPACRAASIRSASSEPPSSSSRIVGMDLGREVGEPPRLGGGGAQPEHEQRPGGGEQPAACPRARGREQGRQLPQVVNLSPYRLLVRVVRPFLRLRPGRCDVPQVSAQRRIPVEPEGDREPRHRRLAHACQLGQLHTRQEGHGRRLPDQTVRYTALRRGEPTSLEELVQPYGGTGSGGLSGPNALVSAVTFTHLLPSRSGSVPLPCLPRRAGERADGGAAFEPGQFTRPASVSHSLATTSESSLSLTSFFIISSRSSVVSFADRALSAALAVSLTADL